MFKNIPVGERFRVQLRGAEMFNLLNRINLAFGGGAVGGNGFERHHRQLQRRPLASAPAKPFNMQLAAGVIF